MSVSVRSFRSGDEPAVMAVVDAALPVDRIPGFSHQDLQRVVERMAGDPSGTAVALENGRIVGFCAPRFDLLSVDPSFRRRGHGRRLVGAALDIVRDDGLDELILYGSTDRPDGAGFIAALGATYHSSMWQFELAPSVAVAAPSFPPDVVVRSYRDPDDLAAYAEVATTSFRDHPTPMYFDRAVLRRSHELPDFDPTGILLVAPADDPATLVGWTKVRNSVSEDGLPEGSVDFVGVVPTWRRRGIGRELLRWGVARLRGNGAGVIGLTVTSKNDRALDLYRNTGFEPAIEWPHYAIPVPRSP
jgi:mycothiol synthase